MGKIKGVAEGRRRRYTPRHVVVWQYVCKRGLAPVAPKCRVVAADADEHERTRSLVTQPLPSKTPPAPSLKRPQEVKESFSGMKNLERCFYPLHTGVRYVGAPLGLRRLTGRLS